jgi:hypothetical protein
VISSLQVWGNSDPRPGSNQETTLTYLESFLSTTSSPVDYSSFGSFLLKLEKKKLTFKNETDFVHYAFAKTHQVYMKRFKEFTSFAGLFTDGTYNCLTGTILYSLILNHFGIRNEVIETNYHIFILAYADGRSLLIEATDPEGGFVADRNEIEERINLYKENSIPAQTGDLSYYRFHFNLYNRVSMDELSGLLFYNLAIESFNNQSLQKSVEYLSEAITRYSSPRIEEFARVLLLAVHHSQLTSTEKSEYKRILSTIRHKAMPVMAGLEP